MMGMGEADLNSLVFTRYSDPDPLATTVMRQLYKIVICIFCVCFWVVVSFYLWVLLWLSPRLFGDYPPLNQTQNHTFKET
jgi:hypothetical protein